MAELYDQNKIYANRPTASSQAPQSADAELEAMLAELPPEERETARAKITAPPTGEDIYKVMQERNANGEVFNMNLDQYRQYKAYIKTKEVDVLDAMGTAAEGVFNEIMAAAGSIYDKPLESTAKLTPSLIEAFAQGTRNLYGMAAQSQDPNSVFFRVKNAITANGDDEEAEFQQFMDAQAFNVQSMKLATGQETWIVDKDLINPEMTQVMSYIADPTLFVPFGGIAAKGARMIGMGEGLARASARAAQIQRKVLGGAIKWGVGAPIEFLGTATRNTIDYGLERAGAAFEVATGMPAAEARTTAQMYGWYTASAALEGRNVPFPVFGDVAGAMVGSTTARGIGESLTMVGEQMQKQQQFGRGILSYAGQALRDANKSGVPLSKHAKALLNVLDKADPLFVYSADISKGAAEGMAIGAGLGYLSAGEEGAASGAGAGMVLGAAGAGMGAVVADVGKGRLYDRIAVQRQMVIEGLRQIDPDKAAAFEALVKTAELNGNRDVIAQIDGIITGIDVMAPDARVVVRDADAHIEWLRSQKIDPDTGRLMEPLALFPEFGTDRKSRAKALSFLSMLGNRFDGDHKLLIKELQGLPQDHSLRKQFMRLSEEQKKSVFDAIDKAATPEFKEKFGGKNGYEFYGDLNYAEANVARVNAMFDAGNKTQANEMIRQFIKDETGKDGKLSARGELLKQKLATEGYFDKDGNMRPSRLKDVEMTAKEFKNAKGFVFRRDSTGQVELHINLKEFGKETLPHELFHAVMLDSVLKPDFIDRLSQNLLGKFDADGKRIENASVDIKQVRQFFQRYIDALHGKNSQDAVNETARLEAAMKEYESRGTTNKIALDTKNTLEGLLEEFGAYYFGAFINDKPVDFLFRGGELGAMREIMGNAKQGFLDFWRSKIKGMNPDFNFDPATNQFIFQAFEKEGVRTKNKSLDLLMRDFVRATAMANKQGGFDVSRLSPAARETFIKNNGIRGLSMTRDANGNLVRSPQRKVIQEQMRVGKEIYKILSGLDPKFRQGLITDGEGNLSGRLSPEAMEAIVQSGHIDRAWVDKIQQAYNILDGKGGNVIHFGYLGRTAQIGDYAWPRLVGSDVPFKNRQAVLLGVDFKVGKDGKMYSLFHTLDKAVIDGRADVLWSDSAVRTLWNGDRGAMEADFFRYLANASKAAGDSSRVESAVLLEDGTGAGARRRDVLHQMLGIVKAEGDVYLNKPIAEIPYGIRHSVTTFNVDGIANMRVGTDRWNVVPENAFKDLSRNFQPSEMAREETPNGAIIKHPLGYKFAEKNGKVRAFDDQGNTIGVFDGIQQAAEAAQKHSVKQKQELIKSANDYTTEQFNQGRKFQVLEKGERDEAVRLGDVFEVLKVKRFTENTNVIRQSRDEYVLDRAERELVAGSTAFYERLIRNAGEEMVNALEAEERYTSAANALTEGISKLEQATAENNLRLKRGEITSEEYNSIGTAIFNDYKNLVKQKDSAGDAYYKYRGQNFTMLSVFLETGAEGDWKQQIRNGELPKLTDEGLEKLNQFARKHIEQYRTNAVQGLPETISALYSDEYNQQFKTGEAFTTVATHGTKSLDLMVAREFSRGKLGTSFKIFSSLNAVFSAGQESTGVRYAGTSSASGTPLHLVISNHSPEFLSAKQDLNVYVGYLLDSLLNSYIKDTLKPTYEQFKARFNKFSTEESARKAYEMHGNEFVVHNGELVSRNRLSESLREVVGYKFESEEFKDLLDYVENYYGQKLKEVIKKGDKVKEQEMMNFIRRLIIRNANDIGTPVNTVYNSLHATDAVSVTNSGGVGAARLISDGYYMLENAMLTAGYSLSDIGIDIKLVQDASSTYYEGVRNSVDANLNRIIAETKSVPMEVRTLVKMNNPLVIEGRKEYGEYYLKDIMEPAMKAGHDGVVFRNMRDGGKYDNIYAVFKDYMDSNLMIIDTSFDDVKMPRGKDSEGNPVRYGRELGLRNQPTEGAEGGRVYDQNSNEFKYGFIGKWAEENPERIKGYNLEFIDRGTKYGTHNVRIRLQDNSTVGMTENVGHITADIDPKTKIASLSSNIGVKYRGNKLSYALYSEMAERLRSMGVQKVDGTIVNSDGIPIKVREKIIGNTKILRYDGSSGLPIDYKQGAGIIQRRQAESGNTWGGLDVVNELDPKARYQPTEGGRTYTPEQMSSKFIGKYAEENPNVVKGLKPKFSIFGSGDQGNIELMKGQDSLGYINFSFSKATGEALIEYTRVADRQQGKGYGNLMYSELVERLRSMGMKEVQGMIVDEQGRPKKIRERIIDRENARIGGDRTQIDYVEKDPDSGDTHTGVTSYLYKKARYQPTEGFKPREEVVRRAREAGYGTTVYYHGTNKDFTEFKSSPRNHSVGASEGRESGNMFFLSSDPLDAEHYKKAWVGDKNKNRIITAFVKLDNPYDVSANAKHLPFTPEQEAILKKYLDKYSTHPNKEYQLLSLIGQQKRGNSPLFQLFERNERAAMLKEMGYDGIKDGRHISVFDSEQIKSADDFTYDDSGKEIPLEERFNKNKKDIRFQPTEGEKAPINWVKDGFNKEGYNAEVVWMTPERFLKLAAPLGDRANNESSRARIEEIKKTLQKKGSDMDMPYFSIKRNKNGELQVSGHEGRHRAIAIQELYGDKKIPVYLTMDEMMKIQNRGDMDFGVSESERKKGTVSKEFKALEDAPFLNELGTGRFQPAEYQSGDDYYKPKKKPSVKIPAKYKDFPTSPEGVDEFGAKIRYAYYFNPKSGELERVDFPHTYMEIGHEINNKEVYLWSLNNADYRKHGVHENSPITLESMERMMRNKESPAHGYGKLALSEVRGRIEMPVYKDGKVVEKGRASIGIVAGGEGKLSAADVRLLKEKIIRKFGVDTISEKDFDFYLYTADKELRSQFGISPIDRLGIKLQPAELEVLNITRTQDIPWFRNLIAGGSYVRYAGIEELNYLRGLQAVSHGADTLTGVDVNTTQGRRIVEGKGGLGYALNPNNEAAWASIGKGFIELINQTVQANLDKEGINQKTALLPLVFTTYRKNLNSVQGSEAYYNIFEILRRGQILSDNDLRIAMSKAVEKLYVNKKGEAVKSQTEALRSIVKNSKMNWDEMLSGIFATLADSDVQNFGTRGRMADDFFGAVWKRLDLSESKKKQIRGLFPEWKTVSKGDNITVEDMKTNVADITTDTLSKNLKNGDVYAILKFNDFVTDTKSNHRSYDTGVVQKDGKKPEIIILKKPVSIDDFYQSSVTSKGEQDLSNITDRSVKTNLLGMNARPYGQARVKLAGSVDFRDVAAKMQPSEGFSNFKTERTPTGVLLKNAAGYVISRVGSKYRVYNPYKAVIGVFDSEEQAKKRIYKEEPRR